MLSNLKCGRMSLEICNNYDFINKKLDDICFHETLSAQKVVYFLVSASEFMLAFSYTLLAF